MVMGFRERRLGCRLYVDRQSDANILKKLDRMLVDGSYSNQTEVIKRGIELMKKCMEKKVAGPPVCLMLI